MKVYIGYDEREDIAYKVAEFSLLRRTENVQVTPLRIERLSAQGLINRPVDKRGVIWDLNSNAPCATDFAISRFLTPILSQRGWALFMDCDMVVLEDVRNILLHADPKYAVMVVKHPSLPVEGVKMDHCLQVTYPRKNWSSVILWNCDHPANLRLSLRDINERPGRDLHRFYWLHDDEIGELPDSWNWLVNVREKPKKVSIAHFTLGGPFTPGWVEGVHDHDDVWLNEAHAYHHHQD